MPLARWLGRQKDFDWQLPRPPLLLLLPVLFLCVRAEPVDNCDQLACDCDGAICRTAASDHVLLQSGAKPLIREPEEQRVGAAGAGRMDARMHWADRATFELLDSDGDGKLDLQEFLHGGRAQLSFPFGAPSATAPAAGKLWSRWANTPAPAGAVLADAAENREEAERGWAFPVLVAAGLAAAAAALSPLAARHVDDPARKQLLRGWLPKGIFVVAWIAFGVAAGVVAQGWAPLTAFYVVAQIITTIGYGDVTVDTPGMRLFCAIYVLVTLLVITTWLTAALTAFLEADAKMLEKRVKKLEDDNPDSGGTKPQKSASSQFKDMTLTLPSNKVAGHFFLFVFFVSFGTVFFAIAEGCTCSYGVTMIEGCVEGPTCPQTGGAVLHWVDSFYMSVISLTTVGFGDLTPKSELGRLVGIPWMITGVTATAMFLGAFSDMINSNEKESRCLDRISDDIFAKIDEDGSGELSKAEFQTYALLKFEIVQEDMLKQISQMFDIIDKDKSGRLTQEEIRSHFDGPQSPGSRSRTGSMSPARVSAPSAALQAPFQR